MTFRSLTSEASVSTSSTTWAGVLLKSRSERVLRNGAQRGTRTLTAFRPLTSEASASTSSATWAGVFACFAL